MRRFKHALIKIFAISAKKNFDDVDDNYDDSDDDNGSENFDTKNFHITAAGLNNVDDDYYDGDNEEFDVKKNLG